MSIYQLTNESAEVKENNVTENLENETNNINDKSTIIKGDENEFFISRATWVNAPNCELCNFTFTFIVRRHHCRICSRTVCATCSLGKCDIVLF